MERDQLAYLSIAEASALVARREVSPLDLADAVIARAEALDDNLHAYITRTFETARVEAKNATNDIAAGKSKGPLHGIPFAIKDIYETAGVETTAGSKLQTPNVPKEDAHTIALLKQAGAVMLGKLNLHEWAMGGTNVNYFFPTPKNPWDQTRITGGSSGGSGLALAAGFCYGSLGTDTRGSIRMPASACGITGLKPTYGRVSIRGIIPLVWSLDHSGPMARSAEDCAMVLNAIAGFDAQDPTSVDAPVPDYVDFLKPSAPDSHPLEGVRIGVPRNFFFDEEEVDAEILAAVRATFDVFAGLGATMVEVDFPDPEYHSDNMLFNAESAAYHEERLRERPEELSPLPRERVRSSQSITGMDYARARWRQAEFKQKAAVMFRDIDLVVTPTVPVSPLKIADIEPAGPGRVMGRHTSPFNILHVPTISLPCGFTSDGLPVGLQIAGRWWEEGLVLRAAHAYQGVTDWHRRRPSL
ncbi:MAG TPA: amidase [Dehalococcoidia bacterium]|nr:amidase [Dehalococcoidia bacterium]